MFDPLACIYEMVLFGGCQKLVARRIQCKDNRVGTRSIPKKKEPGKYPPGISLNRQEIRKVPYVGTAHRKAPSVDGRQNQRCKHKRKIFTQE